MWRIDVPLEQEHAGQCNSNLLHMDEFIDMIDYTAPTKHANYILFVIPSCTIITSLHLFLYTVLSQQQCYNEPNCAGDVVPGPTTAEECCVGTDDGMSFGDSGGTCTASQCIGN